MREYKSEQCGIASVDPQSMEDEASPKDENWSDVEGNELDIEVSIGPDKGSSPLIYRITGLKCDAMPFLADELLPTLALRTEQEADKGKLCSIVEVSVLNLLKAYGFRARINVTHVMSISVAGEEHRERSNRVNLFVDLGSTNSKWIVTDADADGHSTRFLDIPIGVPTIKLCGDWGLDYNKTVAYSLKTTQEFVSWLSYAVLGFVLHVQRDRDAEIVNIKWSFPKIVNGPELDFDEISKQVTKRLKERSRWLHGSFELVPEATALFYMFHDRLLELAQASEAEEAINRGREESEKQNRIFNQSEQKKVEENSAIRDFEARSWRRDHPWKSLFCSPRYDTPLYIAAAHKSESLGRETALEYFRCTGAQGDGNFRMLFLDAGGSTLDYCYISPSAQGQRITGSFRAGGNELTRVLSQRMNVTEDDAEERKRSLSDLEKSQELFDATVSVYHEPLEMIHQAIGMYDSLCVVGTGLAMRNRQLRELIRKVLKLPDNQVIMYSPDISTLFPRTKLVDYPSFKEFIDIVNHVTEGKAEDQSLSWPGADVCGGLYFKAKIER